jgi:heme-degrading monooxygenase HmoA
MYARLTTVRGTNRFDEAVRYLTETILPEIRQQKGFNSVNLAGNRSAGVLKALTIWEAEADRDSSEGFSEKTQKQILEILGGELSVDRFEQVLLEIGSTPPGPGAKLHIRPVKMDPAKVDENLEFFRQTVLPDIKATPGFQGVRQLINRQSGEGTVATVWADEAALETALKKAEARRPVGESRGIEFGQDEVLEILFRGE